nr:MAG TPA: hypothetical protein [Caudoviricetes sp.]
MLARIFYLYSNKYNLMVQSYQKTLRHRRF